jgi:hypothetical protein
MAIRYEKHGSPGAQMTNGYTLYQTMLINNQKKSIYFDQLQKLDIENSKLYNEICICRKYIDLVHKKVRKNALETI